MKGTKFNMNNDNYMGYYAVLSSKILFNQDLKANEKLLYATITLLANKEGYCFATNSYLAKLFKVQAHTISSWISHLSKLEFIKVKLIKNDKGEIIQRRIYINDIPYTEKNTYPYTTNNTYSYTEKNTEGMYQKVQYNNINNKIDRLFNYIINNEEIEIEEFTKEKEVEFKRILQKLELNYTKEMLETFRKENIEKIKAVIYAVEELYSSNKRKLLYTTNRKILLDVYDRCKEKEKEYQNTDKEIVNFYEYYFSSLIKELEKA